MMRIYKIDEILSRLENCIIYKKPFSHIRFGDGGIKFIHSILYKDLKQLNIIIDKEGLPRKEIIKIFNLWGYYARRADFIDTPEVYFNGTFWPRVKKPGKKINEKTLALLMMWEGLYYSAEFDNDNYCNPESNYLMILDIPGRKNLFDLMKKRKVAIITAKPEIKNVLYNYDVDIIPISGQYEMQYHTSFEKTVNVIKRKSREYDFWLIAAGELGRIYTGLIKEEGGRSLDIGFIIEYWCENYFHPRFYDYLVSSSKNRLELRLTDEGKKYAENI